MTYLMRLEVFRERLMIVVSQLLLVTSLLSTPLAYAANEELANVAAALGIDSAEETVEPEANSDSDSEVTESPLSTISDEDATNSQIETTPTPEKDNDIQKRISGIFSEIDGLQAVSVSVSQGIVTLSGETANEKKAQQAINLANRLTDVVAVDDQINRTLDVQDNVTTVYEGLENQVTNLIKAMPLILVGIVIFGVVAWLGSWLSKRQGMWKRLTPNPFVAELLS